ncbi:MAG TPA: hypothetical protein VK735_39610 [Pseudonocardia sp.]|uniref:hypothetical protein n=1 Tax=Pseudonocardia sp. TaxID=60912 RepID=UPI002BE53379|nr:hypothetical protein [Pseudonocardia sp.]HTF53590.1 hypothetical protein [Pseudonocardia sp.]
MVYPPVMGPVRVLRVPGRDMHGDPQPAVEHEQPGCAWAPRSAIEDSDLQNTAITGYWLFAPYDADLRFTDQVIIPEIVDAEGVPVVWQIEGEPGRWKSPWTQEEVGTQMALRRATG